MFRKPLLLVFVFSFSLAAFSQDRFNFPVNALVLPEFPSTGDRVFSEGTITFPHPGYRIEQITHDWDAATKEININLHIYVDILGFYPQIETTVPFRYGFESPFEYMMSIQEFVTIQQVPVDPFTDIAPLPDFVMQSLSIEMFPQPVLAGRPVRLALSGVFPTSGYEFVFHSVVENQNTVTLNAIAQPPEAGLTVITPFTEHFLIHPLAAGGYTLQVVLNGVEALTKPFTVEDRQTLPVEYNPFEARFSIPPIDNPEASHEIFLMGNFRTSGWMLNVVDMQTAGEFHTFAIEALPPDGPAATVIIPFNELIAALKLENGFHYFRGTINGHIIPAARIYVGEVPPFEYLVDEYITLRRTGGFAGDNSWITIDREGNFTLMNRFRNPGVEETGTLPPSTFNELVEKLEASNFEGYPVRIETDESVADVFEYSVVYDNNGVWIEYLEAAPEELQAVVRDIEALLNNPLQTSAVDTFLWQTYN